ncbi:MAG: two-component response regulator [uncultured bacterium (gcode 4)]|uniref:Two-component response regulator n=1 Tax=uncultured bacterium (gcode 4) TaxID=1234023 RepID=K2GSF7_9BACT|nr:MAG: two-component response regulator [uncultured bacterium (gcode 4)]
MKVLIIEDNRSINKNIQKYLKLEWFYTEWVFDWKTGLETAISTDFDLILLDIMLPVIDWITVCKKILEQKKVPIIMITAKDEIGDRILWLESGADDYIVKPFDLWELVARINAVLRRWNKEIYDEIQYGDISILLAKKEIFKNNEKIDLTLKEFLILEYLIQNKNQAVSRTDIINYIWWWEDSMFEWDAKLDVYISNLRKKLDKSLIETIKWFWYRINMD